MASLSDDTESTRDRLRSVESEAANALSFLAFSPGILLTTRSVPLPNSPSNVPLQPLPAIEKRKVIAAVSSFGDHKDGVSAKRDSTFEAGSAPSFSLGDLLLFAKQQLPLRTSGKQKSGRMKGGRRGRQRASSTSLSSSSAFTRSRKIHAFATGTRQSSRIRAKRACSMTVEVKRSPLQVPLRTRMNENGEVLIGAYTAAERRRVLDRYLAKRKTRNWKKKIKYDVRKNFADSRLRVKGRFVSKEVEMELLEGLMLSV